MDNMATWDVGVPGTILILVWIVAVSYWFMKTIFSDSMDRLGAVFILLVLIGLPVAVFGHALLTTPIF